MYCNSEDSRYKDLIGKSARIPLFGIEVPILGDEDVDIDFGTGIMMVCTFGDGEDVRRWKRDSLETRLGVGSDGKLTALAGAFASLSVEEARPKIVKEMEATG